MKGTKERILTAAVGLFNEYGFVNVRLQQIADAAGISVGNMAYHYKNKADMLPPIYEGIQHRQYELLQAVQLTPLFQNFDLFLANTFTLQQAYLFFYLDTLELVRLANRLHQQLREHIHWQQLQLNLVLQLNQARAALAIPEGDNPDATLPLARQLRRTIDNWCFSNRVEGQPVDDLEAFKKEVWQLLLPYFSDEGYKEYEQLQLILQS